MSRLIDAERLRKDILNLQDCYNGFSDTYDKACIIGVIDGQPTIDPVKHGKWIFSPGNVEGACTACNYKIYGRPYQNTYMIVPYNYCPNCGAKMEGEEDGC